METPEIKNRFLCTAIRGTNDRASSSAMQDNRHMIRLMVRISATVLDSRSLSSRTFAHARTPYTGIPSCATMVKYDIIEEAKETVPVPSGPRTLDTYGNVIRGKRMEETVRRLFMMKLRVREWDLVMGACPFCIDA